SARRRRRTVRIHCRACAPPSFVAPVVATSSTMARGRIELPTRGFSVPPDYGGKTKAKAKTKKKGPCPCRTGSETATKTATLAVTGTLDPGGGHAHSHLSPQR